MVADEKRLVSLSLPPLAREIGSKSNIRNVSAANVSAARASTSACSIGSLLAGCSAPNSFS
jgi:hypothetical protein